MVSASPPIKRAKKPQAQTESPLLRAIKTPTGVLCVVVAGTILMVLLSVFPSADTYSDGVFNGYPHSGLNAFFEAQRVSLRGVQILCSADHECRTIARRDIQQQEPVIVMPLSLVIDHRAVLDTPAGAVLRLDNGTFLLKYAEESKLGHTFTNVYAFALWLALERKAGAKSKFAGWFAALPGPTELRGALYWDTSVERCLDQVTAGEAKSLRSLLAVAVKATVEVCAKDASACPDGVPTEDEMRWAVQTYLSRNYQDQAFLPPNNFARVDNSRAGLMPRLNDEDGTLELLAPDFVRKGDEITINFMRGAATQLLATGFFDPQSRGIDARIALQPNRKNSAARKYCVESGALVFTPNGRPGEAVVLCIAAMVANKAQRKNLTRIMRSDLVLQKNVWGNLTGFMQQSLEGYKAAEACGEESDPMAATFRDFVQFGRRTLKANVEFTDKQYVKLASKVAQLPPQEQQEAPAAEEPTATPAATPEADTRASL